MGSDDKSEREVRDEIDGIMAFFRPTNGGKMRVMVTMIFVGIWAATFGYEVVVVGEVSRTSYILTMAVIAVVAKFHEVNVQEIIQGKNRGK